MLKTTFKRYMKPLCIAAISLVVFQSCQKSEIKEQSEEIEPLRNYLAITTGHKLNQINYISATKTFIIDKDVFMSLEDAKKRYDSEGSRELTLSSNGTSQRIYQYTVNYTIAPDIKIFADASVNSNWLNILDQAIAQWNNSGSRLRFSRVTGITTTSSPSSTSYSAIMGTNGNGRGKKDKTPTSPTEPTSPTSPTTPTTEPTTPSSGYHILVTTNYEASSTVAIAYYPSYDGKPGFLISINTYHNGLPDSQKLFAMIHEIGHTVGFTHTDGSFGTLVPGTPTVDQNSVMNSFVLNWSSFTPYDLQAFRTVYPK